MSEIETNGITGHIVDAAYHLHNALGPGLLESVYEALLARELARRKLTVSRQIPLSFDYNGLYFYEALRVDLLIENQVVVEIKSVDRLTAIHTKQILTYLRLLDRPIGLLLNFGAPTMKEGLRRVINSHKSSVPSAAPRLCVNPSR